MKEKLKPCPFCGEEARMVPPDSALPLWHAGCRHCDQGFWGDSEVGAIAAWNTRANDNRRCENCKHWQSPSAEEGPGYCRLFDIVPDRDFDCVDFTKKEDGNE